MPARTSRVRLYHQVRTAHLERAAALPPAVILFANKRYDFAAELASGLDLVPARGWRAAWWFLRHPVETVEINEPLMLPAARSTAIALLGLRLRSLVDRRHTRVVCYAIENLDPRTLPAAGPKARLLRRVDVTLMRAIWRQVDRIVYGTAAARDLYAAALPHGRRPAEELIWALPAPAESDAQLGGAKQPWSVLFLGAFSDRKGFRVLSSAWPLVRRSLPDARLRLIGKGPLQSLAERLAAEDERVTCMIDPPRRQIRENLSDCQVLVLASQPSSTWREQVGLPIVEGLSYGCTIVTTTQTGLATWLRDHGHQVVEQDAAEDALAEAIVKALRHPAEDVRASLPAEDGRLAADSWLFAAEPAVVEARP